MQGSFSTRKNRLTTAAQPIAKPAFTDFADLSSECSLRRRLVPNARVQPRLAKPPESFWFLPEHTRRAAQPASFRMSTGSVNSKRSKRPAALRERLAFFFSPTSSLPSFSSPVSRAPALTLFFH